MQIKLHYVSTILIQRGRVLPKTLPYHDVILFDLKVVLFSKATPGQQTGAKAIAGTLN